MDPNMGSLNYVELSTIRIRSLIAEALSLYLLYNPDCQNRLELLKAIYRSSDTTKQIASWSRENHDEEVRAKGLIIDLNRASDIIINHASELTESELDIPEQAEIDALKCFIFHLTGVT